MLMHQTSSLLASSLIADCVLDEDERISVIFISKDLLASTIDSSSDFSRLFCLLVYCLNKIMCCCQNAPATVQWSILLATVSFLIVSEKLDLAVGAFLDYPEGFVRDLPIMVALWVSLYISFYMLLQTTRFVSSTIAHWLSTNSREEIDNHDASDFTILQERDAPYERSHTDRHHRDLFPFNIMCCCCQNQPAMVQATIWLSTVALVIVSQNIILNTPGGFVTDLMFFIALWGSFYICFYMILQTTLLVSSAIVNWLSPNTREEVDNHEAPDFTILHEGNFPRERSHVARHNQSDNLVPLSTYCCGSTSTASCWQSLYSCWQNIPHQSPEQIAVRSSSSATDSWDISYLWEQETEEHRERMARLRSSLGNGGYGGPGVLVRNVRGDYRIVPRSPVEAAGVASDQKVKWVRVVWGNFTTEKEGIDPKPVESKYGSLDTDDAALVREEDNIDESISNLEDGSLVEKQLTSERTSCSICLGEYESGEIVVLLPCSHFYHDKCIESWTKRNVRCPLCNYDLMRDGVEWPMPIATAV